MKSLYDVLLRNLPGNHRVSRVTTGDFWNLAELSGGQKGLAMTTSGHSIPRKITDFSGLPADQAAQAVKSWNLEEAGAGMAVINACYNTPQRMEDLGCYEPYANYCTEGLDLTGKTVGLIGHLTMPEETLRCVRDVFIMERHPHPGDYPDSACEYLLPKCDVVLITGSSLVNKTLPRLLELSEKAYTIVTGPTVPMCPELLDLNIQRLAGMIVSDDGICDHVAESRLGPPYPYGTTFLLREEGL